MSLGIKRKKVDLIDLIDTKRHIGTELGKIHRLHPILWHLYSASYAVKPD